MAGRGLGRAVVAGAGGRLKPMLPVNGSPVSARQLATCAELKWASTWRTASSRSARRVRPAGRIIRSAPWAGVAKCLADGFAVTGLHAADGVALRKAQPEHGGGIGVAERRRPARCREISLRRCEICGDVSIPSRAGLGLRGERGEVFVAGLVGLARGAGGHERRGRGRAVRGRRSSGPWLSSRGPPPRNRPAKSQFNSWALVACSSSDAAPRATGGSSADAPATALGQTTRTPTAPTGSAETYDCGLGQFAADGLVVPVVLEKPLVIVEGGLEHLLADLGGGCGLVGQFVGGDAAEEVDRVAGLREAPLGAAPAAAPRPPVALADVGGRASCPARGRSAACWRAARPPPAAARRAPTGSATVCRRVHFTALSHTDGGRARIGSSREEPPQVLGQSRGPMA